MVSAVFFASWYAASAVKWLAVSTILYRRMFERFPCLVCYLTYSAIQSAVMIWLSGDFDAYKSVWLATAWLRPVFESIVSAECFVRIIEGFRKFRLAAASILIGSLLASVIIVLIAREASSAALHDLGIERFTKVVLAITILLSWLIVPHVREVPIRASAKIYLAGMFITISLPAIGHWMIDLSQDMAIRWTAQFLTVLGPGVGAILFMRMTRAKDMPGPTIGFSTDDLDKLDQSDTRFLNRIRNQTRLGN
jgi:hypothetical protein